MAKDKEPKTAADVAVSASPAVPAAAPTAESLQAEIDRLRDDLNRVTTLLAASVDGKQSVEKENHLAWAQLSAEEKTKLAVAREYPAEPGTKPFRVRLIGEDGKPVSECFELTLPAHSREEAEGRYRKVMGIRDTKGHVLVA